MSKLFLNEEDYKIAESNGISREEADDRFYEHGMSLRRSIYNDKPVRQALPVNLSQVYKKAAKSKKKPSVNYQAFARRVKDGWTIEKALYHKSRKSFHKDHEKYLKIAETNGISQVVYRQRLQYGWSEMDACTVPKRGINSYKSEKLKKAGNC